MIPQSLAIDPNACQWWALREICFNFIALILFSEVLTVNRIAVPQQVAWELVERQRVPRLLASPLRGRMAGYVEVEDTTTIIGQDQKHVEDLKRMVETVKKSTETSREMWFCGEVRQLGDSGLCQRTMFLGNAGLPGVDAEFEQFAVNARCAPSGILSAHPADQIQHLMGDGGASGMSLSNLSSPKPAKPLTMPSHNRVGLDEDQRRAPIAPKPQGCCIRSTFPPPDSAVMAHFREGSGIFASALT